MAAKRSKRAAAADGPQPVAAAAVGLEVDRGPEGGQDLQPRPERRGALPAGAPDDGGAAGLGVVGGGRGQGGLANPGLAGEGDQPAPEVRASATSACSSASGWSRPTSRVGVAVI
jgi:hypothetical protein